MILDLSKVRIFIRPGSTDLRKAVNGLSAIVQDEMELDPFNGNVYLFCNRAKKLLKAVYWDHTGFWLCQKRLEQDTYPWPESAEDARELSREELHMLLRGIDFFRAHTALHYSAVG